MTGIAPSIALLCFGVWLVILMATHYVSLGSIIAGCCFPVFTLLSPQASKINTPFIIFSFVIAILLIVTHRKNIKRLLNGTESKTYIWHPRKVAAPAGRPRTKKDDKTQK